MINGILHADVSGMRYGKSTEQTWVCRADLPIPTWPYPPRYKAETAVLTFGQLLPVLCLVLHVSADRIKRYVSCTCMHDSLPRKAAKKPIDESNANCRENQCGIKPGLRH